MYLLKAEAYGTDLQGWSHTPDFNRADYREA